MPKFIEVTVKTPLGVKKTDMMEDNSDKCWMYHKDRPKGKIVDVDLLDKLKEDGWVDSPAKIIEDKKETKEIKKGK